MENEKRFNDLDLVVKYFETLQGLTSGLLQQVSTTVGSLKEIFSLSQKDEFKFRVSVLGIIVVENFFSTVRSKCRYPNLWEYAAFSRRAYFELIKNNAEDYLFNGPKKGQDSWKKYGNQRGIDFSIDSINLMSKKEKQDLANQKAINQGTAEDLAFCQEKGREYLCKKRKMTVGQGNQYERPPVHQQGQD